MRGPVSSTGRAGPENGGGRPDPAMPRLAAVFEQIDRAVHRLMPPELNPLARSGAVANTCFLIALVSGVALLPGYSPSVHLAYASIEAFTAGWVGSWLRSLHRYSSDAFLFFVLWHAARIVAAGKFGGARWLAWVSGWVLLGLGWVIGWTGYWLVWDERAAHVATGTARMMDFIPLFSEPLSSSFLANETVPSLIFFLVFFVHMLLPLAWGIGLWLHLARLSRPKLLTGRVLTLWICAALAVLSWVAPASSAAEADLGLASEGFTLDAWYLWPIALSDRLSAGVLWGLLGVGSVLVLSVPWWRRRKKPLAETAQVNSEACKGCTLCSKDCPFDAISMVERPGQGALLSVVDPERCVGCGVCTGACDSDAINLPGLNAVEERSRIEVWVRARKAVGEQAWVAFVCRDSPAGGILGPALLPGYRITSVPCVGWVSRDILESTLLAGADGVLVAACGPGERYGREGADWLADRLAGRRRPRLRPRLVDPARICLAECGTGAGGQLASIAAEFRAGRRAAPEAPRATWKQGSGGLLLAAAMGFAVWLGSDLPYRPPVSPGPEFVLSFKHAGELIASGPAVSHAPPARARHMQGEIPLERRRQPVRVRVYFDGALVLDRDYAPGGLAGDGPSRGTERFSVGSSELHVRVEIGDAGAGDENTRIWEEQLDFQSGRHSVLRFETAGGFNLY